MGEVGMGLMANSLTLGCDCLGEIYYFDGAVNDSAGEPVTIPNAICMHEEDAGIAWKHTDFRTGAVEVRRSRRLVLSTIATVGNYEYGFYWYLYTDGRIEYEVKLTGVLTTGAIAEGETPRHGNLVAPGIYGPHHQHFFSVRLDMSVDGPCNSVYEIDSVPEPPGPANPHHNAWVTRETLVGSEADGGRDADTSTARFWKITNPQVANELGQPVAYKLEPGVVIPVDDPARLRDLRPGAVRPAQPVGHGLRPAGAVRGRQLPLPVSRGAGPARVRRRRRVPARTPTSSSGTPSAPTTSSAPRTGRSCPRPASASTSSRSASSTATRPWTCPSQSTATPRATTASTPDRRRPARRIRAGRGLAMSPARSRACTIACMVAIQIRDVPEGLRDRLSALARQRGQSLQAYLFDVISDEARRQDNLAVLDRFGKGAYGSRLGPDDINDALRSARTERDAEIGALPEDDA